MQDTFILIYVWKYICQPENPSHFSLDGCTEYISTPDILCPFPHLLCTLEKLNCVGYIIGYSFPLTYAKNWEEIGGQKKSMMLVFVSLSPSGDITMT